jgi:hypothetical protein
MSVNQYALAWEQLRARLEAYANELPAGDTKTTVLQIMFTMDSMEPSSEDHE